MQDPHYPRYQNQQDSGYQDYQQGYYPDQQQPEPPLDPAMEKVRRKMIRLLAVSIGVMLIGLMAVLVAVVYKINRAPDTTETEAARSEIPGLVAPLPVKPEPPKLIESQIDLAPGTRLLSQSLSGDQLSLETLLPDGGTELIIYDYRESRILGRIKLGNVE
ncbi:hypothetical protein [Brucella thiophenivorans]|uniref:Fimbrial subunit PilA n=1 Tax=Brucella thiophenivorans TaxID=571255 RepID=A0A256G330_9HYPH|nr:hypothetical protein [Brucella thiophenivorans]OYR21061.1 hypothetical protein CEV31_0682 [Brucella thiophenivorans]